MNRFSLLAAGAVITSSFIACNERMQTTETGVKYKIYHQADSGKVATMMATVKATATLFRNDTALSNEGQMPVYQMVIPPAPFMSDPFAEVLIRGGVQEGDSLIVISKNGIKAAYKIQKVFGLGMDSLMAVDKNEEIKQMIHVQSVRAEKRISNWLKKKNISATKTNDEVYVELEDKGTAPLADPGRKAGLRFTSREMYSGKVINSNIDTSFHQPPVAEYQVAGGTMPQYIDRVIQQMGKGGKARIYIPAAMALEQKATEPGANLKEDICFELELVSVK